MKVSITAGIIGSMLLFASVIDSKLAITALSTRLVMFLGKISFPLYLTHATVIYVISFILHRKFENIGMVAFLVATILTILLSIPVAYLFEKFIDSPSIKISHKLSKLINK
nr:hypothetical protein [Morganella morganii]